MDWDAHAWEKSPLFWPLRGHARIFEQHAEWPRVDEYDRLVAARATPRFRESAPRPRRTRREPADPGRGYDATICDEGVVPSRPCNWHDFFNALVWAAFPETKRRLHERQHRAILARAGELPRGAPSARTREQDGLALLDEGGVALLCAADAVIDARRAVSARDSGRIAELVLEGRALGVVYGHAIYEHLARGDAPVRALTEIVSCPVVPRYASECVARADAALAEALETPGSFTRPDTLRSLPAEPHVLGAR
jgi:hypothetical protein